MDIKDIVFWFGLVAIAVIVWDGLRRMKANKPKVKPVNKDDDYVDPEEEKRKAEIARELPNGGARVREMTESEKSAISSRISLRERVPMLMERVEVAKKAEEKIDENDAELQSEMDFSQALAEPTEVDDDFSPSLDADETTDEAPIDMAENTESEQPALATSETTEAEPASEDSDETLSDDAAHEADPDDRSTVDGPVQGNAAAIVESDQPEVSTKAMNEPQESSSAEGGEAHQDPGPVEDFVVIHVMAKKGEELSGSAVLDLLLTAGLRHGPMDIFHYRNPQGITEFSLANCVQPGTFNPDSMNQVNTPGVTLFMQLPTAAKSRESFDHMYEMAKFLANHLEAEILDEEHCTVTGQRIEYYREKLRTFERSRLIPS